MSNIVIFGTGRGSDVAYRYISKDSPHKVCGFTVDKEYRNTDEFNGLPVVDFEDVTEKFPTDKFKIFVPLGFEEMNRLRYQKYNEAKEKGYSFISYVHSGITQIEPIEVGENCFILENQSINLDVKIGNNVVIWSSNQIGDSTVIKDNCWISSQVCIAGNVTIEPFCIIGINASISHNITVAEESYIGANALIAKDTEPKSVHVIGGTKKAALTSDKFMAIMRKPT